MRALEAVLPVLRGAAFLALSVASQTLADLCSAAHSAVVLQMAAHALAFGEDWPCVHVWLLVCL